MRLELIKREVTLGTPAHLRSDEGSTSSLRESNPGAKKGSHVLFSLKFENTVKNGNMYPELVPSLPPTLTIEIVKFIRFFLLILIRI